MVIRFGRKKICLESVEDGLRKLQVEKKPHNIGEQKTNCIEIANKTLDLMA